MLLELNFHVPLNEVIIIITIIIIIIVSNLEGAIVI